MLPLYKLTQLPRPQRLRKLARLFEEADLALTRPTPHVTADYYHYVTETAGLLAQDSLFSAPAQAALQEAAAALQEMAGAVPQVGSPWTDPAAQHQLRRPINTIRHILAQAVGQQIADWDLVDNAGNLSREAAQVRPGCRIYFEDIRSPFNIGAMFRTAACFGVESIYLSPLCASPAHKRAERTAMGCISLIPWAYKALEELEGPFFALETGGVAVDSFVFPPQGTLIVGSEELGVSSPALDLARSSAGIITIPTSGAKGSLNVSVAFGIAMYHWRNTIPG